MTSSSTDEFILDVSYQSSVISSCEAAIILDHYATALTFVAENPHAAIRDINFMSDDERNQLLYDRNPPYPIDSLLNPVDNISELIELQVSRTPERIAVSDSFDVGYFYLIRISIASV